MNTTAYQRPGIDVAGRRDDGDADRGQEAADPADPEMIGEGEGRVADPAREHLDQRRRLRTVERGRRDDEQQQHGDQDGQVHPRRVGALGIAGGLKRRADRVAGIGFESLELRPWKTFATGDRDGVAADHNAGLAVG